MLGDIHLRNVSGGLGRYYVEDCEFYSNTAGDDGGGAVFLLGDGLNETDEAGIFTLTR